MSLKELSLIRPSVRYFTRFDRFTFDVFNWKRIRRDGVYSYFLGLLRTLSFCVLGFALSVILFPLSFFKSIEFWLMPLGPDKASHFIEGVEMHLRRSGFVKNKQAIKIVIWPQKFPNEALATLYRRIVYIVGPKQKFIAKLLPFVIWRVKVFDHDVCQTSSNFLKRVNTGRTSVSFSENESRKGNVLVRDIFGDENKNFVLFGYTSPKYRMLVDQRYHPKDDLISAIPDPLNFVKVIERLNRLGIGVVRQGLHLDETKELSRAGLAVPNFENFAGGFPDVWLAANCKFLLSACTGSWFFGLPFNKPAVITDAYTPIGIGGLKDNLWIYQLPWNLKEKRYESFAWMSANPRWCYSSENLGIEYTIIKNSPEQIVDVVDEQLARLNGTWVESEEDTELQQRFQRFVWGKDADPAYLPRVGAKFLREHQHLLPN